MFYVWGEEDAGDILVVGFEMCDRYKLGFVSVLFHAPDEDVALWWGVSRILGEGEGACTLLFPQHKRLPSVATVTDATGQSSSGISSWEQLFSAKSQILTLPPLSHETISP